jgi:hypothetical protein
MAHEPRHPPEPWAEQRRTLRHAWELPIFGVKYVVEWIFYYLGRWGLLKILEYSSFLSVMFAVLVYYNETPDRKKQKHYQAWHEAPLWKSPGIRDHQYANFRSGNSRLAADSGDKSFPSSMRP